MKIYSELANKIIKEQESIIGPVAVEQARKVSGLSINPDSHEITLNGDEKEIIQNLVRQYELLFGRTSVEVCKEAVRGIISQAPQDQVPQLLL
jgi:hypothetical protein